MLVLRPGRDVEREMALLDQVRRSFAETATVVVCPADNHALTGLAWDLGADCVLPPAQLQDHLADVVAGLMRFRCSRFEIRHSRARLEP